MEKVILERNNGIAWLIINRPHKRNAIDYDVIEKLPLLLNEIERNEEDKVVAITGAGDEAFCSGGDLSVFHALHTKEEAEAMLSKMGDVLLKLFFFPKPTFACINGTAVGGGCEIATACDFRLASPYAKVGFVQGTLRIITGWGASTFLFERLKQTAAMEMLFTAKRYNAEEAKQLQFIQEIITEQDFMRGCERYLTNYTKLPTSILMAYKRRWLDKFDKEDIKKRVKKEIDECSTLWESEEHHAAVQRFLKKT